MARTEYSCEAVNPPTQAQAQEMIRLAAPLIARVLSLHLEAREREPTPDVIIATPRRPGWWPPGH